MSEAFVTICRRHRLVPVVVIDNANQALALGQALVAGGLPLLEVTLRTPAGLAAIAALAEASDQVGGPDLLVGAGTVLTESQVDLAVSAGANFIVTPGWSPPVVARCLELKVSVLPGVATAGEIMAAAAMGIDLVKWFPAAQLGGPAGLAAIASVFGEMSFVPTGGVGPSNLAEYLAMPPVAALGGSWMVPRQAIAQGDFSGIEQLVRQAVNAVKAVEGERR